MTTENNKEEKTEVKPVPIDSGQTHEGVVEGGFRSSLGMKLVVAFLGLSLIPIIAIGLISYQNSSKSLEHQVFNNLQTATRSREIALVAYFEAKRLRAMDFASDTGIQEHFELLAQGEQLTPQLIDELSEHLNSKRVLDPGIYETFILNPRGKIIVSTSKENIGKNKSKDPYFIGGKKGTYIKDTYYSKSTDTTGFAVSSPIKSHATGEVTGIVVNRYSLDELNQITGNREGLGETGEVYLVNKHGFMVTESRFAKDAILKQKVENEAVKLMRKQRERMDGIYQNYRGKSVVGASEGDHFNAMFGLNWTILAEIEESEAFESIDRLKNILTTALLIVVIVVLVITAIITRQTVGPLKLLSEWTSKVAKGDLDTIVEVKSKDEIGQLASAFKNMIQNLKSASIARERQDWLKTGQVELSNKMRGEQDLAELSRNIIEFLTPYINAQVGAIYLVEGEQTLRLAGSYAYTKRKNLSNEFKFGESLVGEAALEQQTILITNVPDDYIKIDSGLGEAVPHNIVVTPFIAAGGVKGVIELGSFEAFSDIQIELLNTIAERVAIACNAAQSRLRTMELLEETQAQSEELQTQQEELKTSNEELEEQTVVLRESEAKLQTQQEELQAANEELEERSEILERQKTDIETKNVDLQEAQKAIKEKAQELELSSKYKSEFLANMSHELRTPLNSLLILSKHLADNKESNLTDKQVEYARTVHSSGYDLLALINDILDLSKIESGKMQLQLEAVPIEDISNSIRQTFMPLIQKKSLTFDMKMGEGLPVFIRTDMQRVNQIVKNLLSNAIKFTHEGGVTVNICRPAQGVTLSNSGLDPIKSIAIAVTDTGIGIPDDKKKLIFEAFQQADGSTSRKYGGTGLGLSFSRELVKLLGGEIQLESEAGKGSTFTMYLPESLSIGQATEFANKLNRPTSSVQQQTENTLAQKPVEEVPIVAQQEEAAIPQRQENSIENILDDRKDIQSGDKSILIVEDDAKFAGFLVDLAHEKGFKCLIAGDGETGLQFAENYKPSAIILDISLPGINGWAVLENLKDNPETRNIPVHFMSASEKNIKALQMGAIGYLTKPISEEILEGAFKHIEEIIAKGVKKLLIVEDNEKQKKNILTLVGEIDIDTTVVSTGEEAYEHLKAGEFDSVILNPWLANDSGLELLEKIKGDENFCSIPIIIYSAKELSEQEKTKLCEYGKNITIKNVKSPEMLLDEVVLFLHLVESTLSENQQKMLRMIHDKEAVLKEKKILLVDDDVRNVFALSSVLEDKGMKIVVAKNGKDALDSLDKNPDVSLVLMDIMMPEMDGYEAIRRIRKQEKFVDLPVIALTAKAMKGDRNKCIEAGANDYIAKPIDGDRLLSLLRVWLYKGGTK